MVSGSHGPYEPAQYHQHETASPDHRGNGAERFHFNDHGGRSYRDPAPYYGDQGHGRHHHGPPPPPSFRRHHEHHHMEQYSMQQHHHNGHHHRGMESPAYATHPIVKQRHEYHEQHRNNGPVRVSNMGSRFSRHVETDFLEAPTPAYAGEAYSNQSTPRFADLSPHSTDLGVDFAQHHPPKPTLAPSNARKRKGNFSLGDDDDEYYHNEPQIVPDVHEEAGASLLLHFSRQSGHDSSDEKSPDEVAKEIDGKSSYKAANMLFEAV
jgi:hypothetical protein